MTQMQERLELPLSTYRAIEQIAQKQGTTFAETVGNLVQRFYQEENVSALRSEYQQLANRELAHCLTSEEAARLEVVAEELSTIEMQSEVSRQWEEQTETMNALLRELKETLQTFPDKKRA